MSRLFIILLSGLVWATSANAQNLTALARVDPARAEIVDADGGLSLRLGLSQPVPYRVFTLDAPWRLVLDFSEVDWSPLSASEFDQSAGVEQVALGAFRPGWSRMVVALAAPYAIESVAMNTEGTAELSVTLSPTTAEEFAAVAGVPSSAAFDLPPAEQVTSPRPRQTGDRPVRVALDPGHGGIDPGAERAGIIEADLMLSFARELREVLLRAGFEVVLTRDADVFVPLEMRQSIARAKGADVFISLHADAIAQGRASGATIYTLSKEASDIASEILAERHDRADLLAGVDLTEQDDAVANVLMDLARAETEPRTDRLADALVDGLRRNVQLLHKRPRLEAGFSVLKAADIPSVLIELGFMSSATDLANLRSADWRAKAALGIRDALQEWAVEDAAEALLLRQ